MTSYEIDVVEPDHEPRRLTVDGTLEVGRECDGLNLDDGRVSRRHLTLAATDDGLVVTDLGSTNGTLVNGVRIDGPTLITARTPSSSARSPCARWRRRRARGLSPCRRPAPLTTDRYRTPSRRRPAPPPEPAPMTTESVANRAEPPPEPAPPPAPDR